MSRTLQVVKEKGRQTWRVAGESGCTSSESLYVFPLTLWVSFGCTVFLWVYVCVFLSGYVILMIFQVCVYGYTEEERCASHKGPGRSGGGKIHFSPPLIHSLAED